MRLIENAISPEVPTIDEMQANYDKFCAAVDRDDTLAATLYAAVCADHVAKLLTAPPVFTAAPEMYEALKSILGCKGFACDCGIPEEVFSSVAAAIDKAEGR
jgi:hypothetical protein